MTISTAGRAKTTETARRAGTIALQVNVMPEDLFSEAGDAVTGVAATNSYVLVQRNSGQGTDYTLFDQSQRTVAIPKDFFPHLVLEAGFIAEYLRSLGKESITLDPAKAGGSTLNFKDLTLQLEMNERETVALKTFLQRTGKDNGRISASTLDSLKDELITTLEFRLSTDEAEKYIILERGKALFVYRTVDEDLRPLPIERWKKTQINDRTRISPEQIAETPILAEYADSSGGRQIDGLGFSANLKSKVLTIVGNREGTRMLNEQALCYTTDPGRRGNLFFISPDGVLKSVDLLASSGRNGTRNVTIVNHALPIDGEAVAMRFDPHGNFLAVLCEDKGSRSIVLLERDTLEPAGRIPDVGQVFDFNQHGDIFYHDSTGRLRQAATNIHEFSPNGLAEARELERRRLEALLSESRIINLPPVQPQAAKEAAAAPTAPRVDSYRQDIIEKTKTQVTESLTPEVEKAGTVEALRTLAARVEQLKEQPTYSEYPEVFAAVDTLIADKIDGLEAERLLSLLKQHAKVLSQTKWGTEHLIGLNKQWSEIRALRESLTLVDTTLRQRVDSEYETVRDQTMEIKKRLGGELDKELGAAFPKIRELVEDTHFLKELSALKVSSEFVEFERITALIVDEEKRDDWRKRYKELLRTAEERINSKQCREDQERMTRIAQALEDSRAILGDIENALKEIGHTTELSRWRTRNPLLLRHTALLIDVPAEFREREERKLEELLDQRKKELLQVQNSNLQVGANTVKFLEQTFPVFPASRLFWKPTVKPIGDSMDRGVLVWRDDAGREYRPDWQPVPFDLDSPDTAAAVTATRMDADLFFEKTIPEVPKFDPNWVLNDWTKGYLDRMAEELAIQEHDQSGILILKGETGCGKDVLWSIFAHFTARGLKDIPFNQQTEKEDLTHDTDFKPNEGTVRVISNLVQSVQTPGTIVTLGEINTASQGVLKMLNSLTDSRRRINMNHGPSIKVDPTVLLGATMNPKNGYAATDELSAELLRRAIVINVEYPPLKKDGSEKFLPYEAEMMAKKVPQLADLSQAEFYALWDYVVNNERMSDGQKFASDERKKLVNQIFEVVKVADKIRDNFRRWNNDEENAQEAKFVFSLGESSTIAARLKPTTNVRAIMKRVILDKISNPDERIFVEGIIDNPDGEKA
ncbi:MAG: AAA family ATPase [Oligoflexia bacterium]|nr:AAA family ATPase [Oligoflexia bacterium]